MSGPRRSSVSESTQRRHALILSTWKPLLPLTVFAFLVFYDNWVSTPSCNIVPTVTGVDPAGQYDVGESQNPDDLKVMIVANLLLLGSEAGFFDLYFREYYLSKYFRKSFDSLKPDMLLVLGDVSARGSELTKTKWVSVLYQFHRVLGPFLELPYHVVLGDRDVGQCSGLDTNSVHRIARNFPGLDSAGCGAFEISNVSFVSLNAVALLCGNNKLRFSVERVIETESSDMRMDLDGAKEGTGDSSEMGDDSEKIKIGIEGTSNSSQWRKNVMESGSGPVLLLHFPLHRWPTNNGCQEIDISMKAANPRQQGSEALDKWGFTDTGPYELLHTVPPNDTEYIFQALKPRIVFSAHTHAFCDHTHSDGTREVTVPAMTWKVRDDPGFIVATFHSDRNAEFFSCTTVREASIPSDPALPFLEFGPTPSPAQLGLPLPLFLLPFLELSCSTRNWAATQVVTRVLNITLQSLQRRQGPGPFGLWVMRFRRKGTILLMDHRRIEVELTQLREVLVLKCR